MLCSALLPACQPKFAAATTPRTRLASGTGAGRLGRILHNLRSLLFLHTSGLLRLLRLCERTCGIASWTNWMSTLESSFSRSNYSIFLINQSTPWRKETSLITIEHNNVQFFNSPNSKKFFSSHNSLFDYYPVLQSIVTFGASNFQLSISDFHSSFLCCCWQNNASCQAECCRVRSRAEGWPAFLWRKMILLVQYFLPSWVTCGFLGFSSFYRLLSSVHHYWLPVRKSCHQKFVWLLKI